MDKIGELPQAEILAQCSLYSKMADGLLWHIGPLGSISRTAQDILNSTDPYYWGRSKYGATSDRDREAGGDFFPHEKPLMTYEQNAYMDSR